MQGKDWKVAVKNIFKYVPIIISFITAIIEMFDKFYK